jgi:hypothetical protein
MPPPGEMGAAELTIEIHDVPWEAIYLPLVRTVAFLSDRLNALQFLSIRQYLTLVFFALVILLVVVALWS